MSTAIVYITDTGFLWPTLVSARQMAPHARAAACDVLVFLVDVGDAATEAMQAACAPHAVQVHRMSSAALQLPKDVTWTPSHVSLSSLARLVLSQHLPAHYTQVLYVDGDTQVVGDVSELLALDVPHGKVAAVREGLWLRDGEPGWPTDVDRPYLDGLGIADARHYFNAGVLKFATSTWREAGPRAFRFFATESARCKYHDQSALNHTFAGQTLFLSPAYNFLGLYQELGLQAVVKPAIVHFTGPWKPWLINAGWLAPYAAAYSTAAVPAALAPLIPSVDPARRAELEQRVHNTLHNYRRRQLLTAMRRRARFAGYALRNVLRGPVWQ